MSSLSDIIKLMLKHLTLPQDIYTWLNIDNSYFQQIVGQIYLTVLQLNTANSFDIPSPF